MARLPRLVVPGMAHHVVLRGHNGQRVFADDDDRRRCLDALAEGLRAQSVALLAYALLDDEVRLLLVPQQADAIGRLLQGVGRRYGAYFNRRHARRGTLWDGRFRAGVVEPGEATLQCLCWVDGLPQQRGHAADAAGAWGSAAHRLGLRRDRLVTDPPEYWALGNTPFEREAAWARRLRQGLDPAQAERLEHAARHGWAWGSAAFAAGLADAVGRATAPRPRGRPPRSPAA